MAEKVTLTISPAVATFVRPGTTLETRLSGCAAAESMSVADRLMLLFCLSKDAEPAVRTVALANLAELPVEVIREYADCPQKNQRITAALPALCKNYPDTGFPSPADDENQRITPGQEEAEPAEDAEINEDDEQ
ncbi:MAG: hypothetical protein PHI31_04640 [Desulfuromonadaceae bacterium]|nr:hypothetical protein [Desulfuromonadaceae bacterium]